MPMIITAETMGYQFYDEGIAYVPHETNFDVNISLLHIQRGQYINWYTNDTSG